MDSKKKAYLAALEKSLGVVSSASHLCGLPRSSFYKWMKEDEEFAEEVNKIKEISLDYAESQLLKQIGKGNVTAIIFYLKCQGKSRGYVEKDQQEEQKPIKIEIVEV